MLLFPKVNTDKSPNILNQYHLKGKYDAKVSVIFYNNGTLMVQGCITSFYVEFITEVLHSYIFHSFRSYRRSVCYPSTCWLCIRQRS